SPPFSLLTRLPPTSPLFPYTTLFRSTAPISLIPKNRAVAFDFDDWGCSEKRQLGELAYRCGSVFGGVAVSTKAENTATDQDAYRSEGTRLNSSHVAISYAVFCLKKKK